MVSSSPHGILIPMVSSFFWGGGGWRVRVSLTPLTFNAFPSKITLLGQERRHVIFNV